MDADFPYGNTSPNENKFRSTHHTDNLRSFMKSNNASIPNSTTFTPGGVNQKKRYDWLS